MKNVILTNIGLDPNLLFHSAVRHSACRRGGGQFLIIFPFTSAPTLTPMLILGPWRYNVKNYRRPSGRGESCCLCYTVLLTLRRIQATVLIYLLKHIYRSFFVVESGFCFVKYNFITLKRTNAVEFKVIINIKINNKNLLDEVYVCM